MFQQHSIIRLNVTMAKNINISYQTVRCPSIEDDSPGTGSNVPQLVREDFNSFSQQNEQNDAENGQKATTNDSVISTNDHATTTTNQIAKAIDSEVANNDSLIEYLMSRMTLRLISDVLAHLKTKFRSNETQSDIQLDNSSTFDFCGGLKRSAQSSSLIVSEMLEHFFLITYYIRYSVVSFLTGLRTTFMLADLHSVFDFIQLNFTKPTHNLLNNALPIVRETVSSEIFPTIRQNFDNFLRFFGQKFKTVVEKSILFISLIHTKVCSILVYAYEPKSPQSFISRIAIYGSNVLQCKQTICFCVDVAECVDSIYKFIVGIVTIYAGSKLIAGIIKSYVT